MSQYTYADATIESFVKGRSKSIKREIEKIFTIDIVLKLIGIAALAGNAVLYRGTPGVVLLCAVAILLLVGLAYFEVTSKRGFRKTTEPGQDTKQNLSSMLAFLETRFTTSAFSISSSYVFLFLAGVLGYFYGVYGRVRALDGMDLFVFTVLCLIGVAMNFAVVRGQVKYFVKHLRACLSNLNEDILEVVSGSIEAQQRQDKVIRLLLGLVIILGFVVLIAVLKNLAG